MAIAMEAIAYELLDTTECELFGELRYGGNGSFFGIPEYDAGTSADEYDFGRVAWDSDLSDGLDSGWRDVELIVRLDSSWSQIDWSIDGSPITYFGPQYSAVQQIQIRSVVDTQALMSWDGLQVTFYNNGVQTDSYTHQSVFGADRTDETGYGVEEHLLTIVPGGQSADEVRIAGRVRMTAPSGVPLNDNAIFSQVLIGLA